MDGNKVITIGRQELYDRVWATPMRTLAAEFGMSDVGLAKACRRHHIPCPPRGHWAKKRHGKVVRRRPLPPCPDPALQTITIHLFPPNPPEPAAPALDPDLAGILDTARGLTKLIVPAALRSPHPLVEAARTRLDGVRPDRQGLLHPPWNAEPTLAVAVGPDSVPRALRFLDALIKAVERVGGRVEVKKSADGHKHETAAVFGGERAPLRLRERYRQVAIPPERLKRNSWGNSYEYVLTGEFVLDGGPSVFGDSYAKDGRAAGTVENQLNAVLVKLIERAGRERTARRANEAERHRREEEVRRRREQAERERLEKVRVETLLAEADAWQRAVALRRYIAAVEQRAATLEHSATAGTDLGNWLAWAREQAEKLDPVSRTAARLTGTLSA